MFPFLNTEEEFLELFKIFWIEVAEWYRDPKKGMDIVKNRDLKDKKGLGRKHYWVKLEGTKVVYKGDVYQPVWTDKINTNCIVVTGHYHPNFTKEEVINNLISDPGGDNLLSKNLKRTYEDNGFPFAKFKALEKQWNAGMLEKIKNYQKEKENNQTTDTSSRLDDVFGD